MMKKLAAVALTAISVTACAGGYAGQDYTPVVDVRASAKAKNIPEMEAYQLYRASLEYCQTLGNQRSPLTAGAQNTAVGAAVGAAGGAIGGAIAGRPGYGAGLGAATAALGAGTYSVIQGNAAKQDIVISCLRDDGWIVRAR